MNFARHARGGLLILLPGLALLPLLGCPSGTADDAAAEATQAKPVQVMPVGRADIVEVLNYVADLKPYSEVKVYSALMDRILYFPWQDGDMVKRGQRIALIRSEGLSKGLEGMAAQMEGLDIQIKSLEDEVTRSRALLDKGVMTQAQFDKVESGLLATRANRKALEANRGQLKVTANNAVVTAPISGVIAGKLLEKGDMASPQLPLCRILAIEKLKVHLALIEDDVPKVKLGQKLVIELDAFPGESFAGEVTAIMPYLDAATRTNQVEVTVLNPVVDEVTEKFKLKPGMYGRAQLEVSRREAVLVAPERALLLDAKLLEQQQPGETLRKAFVVKGDQVEKRLIRAGARKGSLFEILDGLAEGEKIVVRGQHGLRDGQQVEVVGAVAR